MANLIQLLQTALEQSESGLPDATQRILLKEALQAFVLDFLYNHPHYRRLNLYGGTCLRVVYQLNRLSEDIDLDNSSQVNLSGLNGDLLRYFTNMQPGIDISAHQQRGESGVLRITLRFPVLFSLGLTAHKEENLHLKVEISHHNQVAVLQRTPVLAFSRAFVPVHFSLDTMMAGKMIACLERSFFLGHEAAIKGRDYYDLLWFMQQRVEPLEDKLAKDGKQVYDTKYVIETLREKVSTISRRQLAQDLLPLFENRAFIDAWLDAFHDNFERFSRFYLEK
jgi:predicted nucleotidyltransferase component of viral defense system